MPDSIVKISFPNKTDLSKIEYGSGVVIGPRHIVTCAHVLHPGGLTEPEEVWISFHPPDQKKPVIAKPVRIGDASEIHTDLALLETVDPNGLADIAPIAWGSIPAPGPGNEVWLVGWPLEEYSYASFNVQSGSPQTLVVNSHQPKGASGGAAVWHSYPNSYCVGLVCKSANDRTNVVITRFVLEFLAPMGFHLPTTQPAAQPSPTVAAQEVYRKWVRDSTAEIRVPLLVDGQMATVNLERIWVPSRARQSSLPITEALARARHAVIVGGPGSGKSTLLRRLAYQLASGEKGLPFLIPIGDLEEFIGNRQKSKTPGDFPRERHPSWIAHYLADRREVSLPIPWQYYEAWLQEPESLLLLDGLDEASTDEWRRTFAEIFEAAKSRYRCRIFFTTRPEAEHTRELLAGSRYVLEDLTQDEVGLFLQQWFANTRSAHDLSPEASRRQLLMQLQKNLELRRLSRNPLMLTMLAAVHTMQRRLPEGRAKVYDALLNYLAETRIRKDEFQPRLRLAHLAELAYRMQRDYGAKRQVLSSEAPGLIRHKFPAGPSQEDLAAEFLSREQADSGIVSLRGKFLEFWHRSFQEYLAAYAISLKRDHERVAEAIAFLDSGQAREVLCLLAGYIVEPSDPWKLNDVFSALVNHALAKKELAHRAYAFGVIASMYEEVKSDYSMPNPEAYEKLRQSVLSIFDDLPETQQLSIAARVQAADALALGGDPRLATPGDGARYWVDVPAGGFFTGDSTAFQSMPRQWADVPAFQIGRYPVTVQEYRLYLDDTHAPPPLDEENWERQLQHPSRPVVEVRWDEANAYCAWVTRAYGIVTCRLPCDVQWEFAARGPEPSRTYPSGEDNPNAHYGNYRLAEVGSASPVGLFPRGATPGGILDLGGNVWEWTRSSCGIGYSLRGASYHVVVPEYLRAACRLVYRPDFWGDSIGFRCVREYTE